MSETVDDGIAMRRLGAAILAMCSGAAALMIVALCAIAPNFWIVMGR